MDLIFTIITILAVASSAVSDIASTAKSELTTCNSKYQANMKISGSDLPAILNEAVATDTSDSQKVCVYDCLLRRLGALGAEGLDLQKMLTLVMGEGPGNALQCVDLNQTVRCVCRVNSAVREDATSSTCQATKVLIECMKTALKCPL
ncbi:uncharacterized protein LOC134546272 [Bacillus rossius redtenbacheri]|uniref:uncharacterized protein LOC134546272 n=1 Tax=Bacillus rossius redtenbacheri TaxID=93214 RepID=UPI002FDD93AB